MITLAPNAIGFSLVNAVACARVSAMAYDPPPIGVTRIDSELAHVIILDGTEARMVGFRGTGSLRDFVTDAKYCRKNIGDGCEVHIGFDEGVASIESQLISTLANFVVRKPLYFMGHSYGGACAQRFADLWDQRRELRGEVDMIHGIYTFGQPRFYNRTAARKYDARLGTRSFRLVHGEDIVARMPLFPPPAIFNLHSPYWHCGQEIFFPSTGGYIDRPSLLQIAISDVIGFYGAYKRQGILGAIDDPLADHAVAKNYVGTLEAIRGEDCPTDSPAGDQEAAP